MKKAFILVLAAMSLFAFAGCASGYDSTTGYDGYGYDGYGYDRNGYDTTYDYNGYNDTYRNYYNGNNSYYNDNMNY